LAGITPISRNSFFSVFLALSNTSRLSSPVISVAFHVRFEVPSVEACCEPDSAWASAVSDPHFKKLTSKNKRVSKRIMTERINRNSPGIQYHVVRDEVDEGSDHGQLALQSGSQNAVRSSDTALLPPNVYAFLSE
jgi:hypothetical protein